MSRVKFIDMAKRLKDLKGLRYDREVAELLGLSKTAFSERKRRDSIPKDKVAIFCERESINMDWLLTGEGTAYRRREGSVQGKVPEGTIAFTINVRDFVAEHNGQVIRGMAKRLERIINENDYRKTSALKSFLEVLDPEEDSGEA